MLKSVFFLFILTFSSCYCTVITEFIKEIVEDLDEVMQFVSEEVNIITDDRYPSLLGNNNNIELFTKMDEVMNKVDNYSDFVTSAGLFAMIKLDDHIDSQDVKKELNDFLRYFKRINIYYDELKGYKLKENKIELLTLEDFAKSVISVDMSSVKSVMREIHDSITSEYMTSPGFLKTLKGIVNKRNAKIMCDLKQSPNQILYNIFNLVALTELKAYAMMQFSYKILIVFEKGHFREEIKLSRNTFKTFITDIIQDAQNQLSSSEKLLFKCDPENHIRGITYEEITNFLQGYIDNEANLSPTGSCNSVCEDHTYTRSYSCMPNTYCQKQNKCNGRVIKCRFIKAHMSVCPSTRPGRRYEFIRFDKGPLYGHTDVCYNSLLRAESWTRWFVRCNYCFCICDEQSVNSDRYFNMLTYSADVDRNRVVTGMRFIKNKRIIHLQIQQGKLLPEGKIDPNTVEWVPLHDYGITDKYIKEGKHFYKLTWENSRIDLNEITTFDRYIVTGVEFITQFGHLQLKIHQTAFDFKTGKLKQNSTIWNSPTHQKEFIRLDDSGISSSSYKVEWPKISAGEEYTKFTHTSPYSDAAQTTIPFIDIQPVESKYPVPLIGAGIYFKFLKWDDGGFIAPLIFTYDYSKHMQLEINDVPVVTTENITEEVLAN